jgi:hypothetical protein
MLKLQAILQDGSVGLEFMTQDPSEAKEMVRVFDGLDWVSLKKERSMVRI